MMKHFGYNKVIWALVLMVSIGGCKEEKRYHDEKKEKIVASTDVIADILTFQKELNEEYRDPETSPLPDRYKKDFEALDFFDIDTAYSVMAKLSRTPNALPFSMPTTGERTSEEVVFGILTFTLEGKEYELEVYQDQNLMLEEEYVDYLFLPFMDTTNGEETYGGGRYMDLRIPEGDSIRVDFNKAYNPYCAYNKKYSCPIVPKVNSLPIPIRAGVKAFKKK